MPFRPVSIANQLIEEGNRQGVELGLLKVLKLAYFAEGHFLTENGSSLISEPFEAWEHGPVSRSIYVAFRPQVERAPKSTDGAMLAPILDKSYYNDVFKIQKDRKLRRFITRIIAHYAHEPAWNLVDYTHEMDSPWDKAFNANHRIFISSEAMKTYFATHPLPDVPEQLSLL